MDQSLLSGLLLAAVSGLSLVAYKHPNAYARIYLPLLSILGVFLASAIAWNAGILFSVAKLLPFVPAEQTAAAKFIAEELSIPALPLVVTPLAISAFLIVLLLLPRLIAEDKKKTPPEEK